MTPSESVIFEPSFLFMLALIGVSVWFGVAARRRQVAWALVVAAASNLFCGALIAGLGATHAVAVVSVALFGLEDGPGGTFVYDFRFYSLVLLGVLLIVGGLACLGAARGLTRGDLSAWRLALWATLALLAINVPLVPIQGFAVGFSVFTAVNLALLWSARRAFPRRAGA